MTPEGGAPVEGPTATKAWRALYESDASGAERTLGLSGDLMFGLAQPRVQRALEALPGAARCDRYCGWPEGEQPEAVALVRGPVGGQGAALHCIALRGSGLGQLGG